MNKKGTREDKTSPEERLMASKNHIFTILLAVLLVFSAETLTTGQNSSKNGESSLQFVRFRNGDLVFGQLKRIGPGSFRFQPISRRITITLSWSDFPRKEQIRIWKNTRFEEETERPRKEGIRLKLQDGSEMVGFLKGSHPDMLEIQTTRETKLISRNNIKEKSSVMLDPTRYQGATTLFKERKSAVSPSSARDHWKLGLFAMKLELFDRAETHLQKAGNLDEELKEAASIRIRVIKDWKNRSPDPPDPKEE